MDKEILTIYAQNVCISGGLNNFKYKMFAILMAPSLTIYSIITPFDAFEISCI